jgi:hypothetical protein
VRLFFVMGAPKSGTTWLQTMLNLHPQVSCFGEGQFIDSVARPMDAMLRDYNRQLMLVGQRVYSGRPHYLPLADAEILGLIRATILRLVERAGPPPQSIWWGDKTPAYAAQLAGLDTLFPDCRFFEVVRDPRDVAVSSLFHAVRAGVLTDLVGDIHRRRWLIGNAITRWRDHVGQVEAALPRLGGRLLRLRYETLADRLDEELPRVFGHLPGIAITAPIVQAVTERSAFKLLSGGREPGQTDDTSFFRSGTHGSYARDLRPEEIRFIEDQLGSPMQAHGYI